VLDKARHITDHDISIARGLRRIRRERNYSYIQMSVRLGVSVSKIYRMEHFERPWALDLDKTADLLGTTTVTILTACKHCEYKPPEGYTCNICGTSAEENK
jgi:transcriptional regulator with XRE-family HTH domain